MFKQKNLLIVMFKQTNKRLLLAKVFFCGYTYSTSLMGHIVEQVNREEKSHADWTKSAILEQTSCEKEKRQNCLFSVY